MPNLHYLFDPNVKGEFFSKWDDIELTKQNIDARMQSFLDLKDKSLEPDIFPSPEQMAKRVTKVIYSQILFAGLTHSSYRTNFVNGSHEPVVMSFIYYALNDFKTGSGDFVKQLGGSIEFAEGFDIHVYQESDQVTDINLIFRGITKPLNLKLLEDFID